MKKQLTHTDSLRMDVMLHELLVRELLEWDEQAYENMRYDMGIQWMERKYIDQVADALSAKPEIWNFWKLKYADMDRAFLESTYEMDDRDDFELFYKLKAQRLAQSDLEAPYHFTVDAWKAYVKDLTDNKVCR